MRKSFITVIIILITPFFLQSQDLTLVIEKMIVFDYDYIHTGTNSEEKGPSLTLYCSLKNNTSDTIELVDKRCVLEFFYDEFEYTITNSLFFNITEVIAPYSELKFSSGYRLLKGTSYFPNYVKSGTRMDYREMLMQILPTIKMKFDYKGKKIVSKEIKEVVLGEREP